MKKKRWLLIGVSLLLLLSACASNEGEEPTETASADEEVEGVEEAEEVADNEESTESKGNAEIEDMLKTNTDAEEISILYQNDTPLEYTENDLQLTIHSYTYYEIKNFTRDLSIPFEDQTDVGGIVLLSVEVENNQEESVYTGGGYHMEVTGVSAHIGSRTKLLDPDSDLVSILVGKEFELTPGENISGYVALAVKPSAMDKISEHGEAMLQVPGIYKEADSFSKEDELFGEQRVTIPFSAAGEESVANAEETYPDKATVDNMGKKEILVANDLDETNDFEEIEVTLEGYQIVEFTPNEDEAPRFSNFETGVILLTTKINVNNQGSEGIHFETTSATLEIGTFDRFLNENMLSGAATKETLEPGEEGTKYIVFVFEKEAYDKLYNDQKFTLDVALYDENFARMTSNEDITFEFEN